MRTRLSNEPVILSHWLAGKARLGAAPTTMPSERSRLARAPHCVALDPAQRGLDHVNRRELLPSNAGGEVEGRREGERGKVHEACPRRWCQNGTVWGTTAPTSGRNGRRRRRDRRRLLMDVGVGAGLERVLLGEWRDLR